MSNDAYIYYKGFTIAYSQKPIPVRSFDYDFAHKDYDGEGDDRCGNGSSLEDCIDQIDEILQFDGRLTMIDKFNHFVEIHPNLYMTFVVTFIMATLLIAGYMEQA